MRLGLWQGEFPECAEAALSTMESALREAKEADMVVFPELFVGGYLLKGAPGRALQDEQLESIKSLVRREKKAVVFGYFECANGKLYNSALAIDADGCVLSNYRKTHLFGADEKKAFSPGEELCEPFDICGIKASLMICYDLEFPETARVASLRGAQLLLVPTANMEPYDVVNDSIVRVRALENHAFVCYCNWSGFLSREGVQFNGRSSVADPNGEVMVDFKSKEIGLKVVQLTTKGDATTSTEDDYIHDRRPELYNCLLDSVP